MEPFRHRRAHRKAPAARCIHTHPASEQRNLRRWYCTRASTTRHIHAAEATLPCPQRNPRQRAASDAPGKKHRTRPTRDPPNCLRPFDRQWLARATISPREVAPSAFLSASSGTFNSLFKVLFIFPSWYLFAIGFEPIFSLR